MTVGPVLYASTHLDADREHRVRGLFHSVNSADNTFVVDLLPLYLRRGEFGRGICTGGRRYAVVDQWR